LLNSGEIPNLLGKEEIEEAKKELADEAGKLKINDPFELFAERIRN